MNIISRAVSLFRERSLHAIKARVFCSRPSFSQFGEDLIILHHVDKHNGFYVDVGAFDPVLFSNTFLMHWHGCRGINIDASKKSVAAFEKMRPKDINLNYAVSDEETVMEYFQFSEASASNYLQEQGAEEAHYVTEQILKAKPPEKKTSLRTRTLAAILDEHLPAGVEIDYLNVDCEGMDLRVLRSNNWDKYRPKIFTVEDWQEEQNSEIVPYCCALGYNLLATFQATRVFLRAQMLWLITCGFAAALLGVGLDSA